MAGRTGLVLGLALAAVAAAPALAAKTIQVGSLSLQHCNADFDGYCGSIRRPLDPEGKIAGATRVGFEWYPRRQRGRPALGTVLTIEGGPGYASTDSREGYVRLFTPLRDRRDILIIDLRGTGTSGAIDCPGLQSAPDFTPANLAACGRQLGRRAQLYGSAAAADDVAAVLDALGLGRIDYYGDSYGTFLGQVFAVRHPQRLRTLTLDSAYPVTQDSPWFESEWDTAVRGFALVCRRSPSCHRLGGSASARLEHLLDRLRRQPITGRAPDGDGTIRRVTAEPGVLLLMMLRAGNGPTAYRDLDAAARALLERGDRPPLLRLVAETINSNTVGGGDPAAFSVGLYTAVVCSDYPLLFDLAEPRAVRTRQLAAGIARKQQRDPEVFAPFTIGEFLASPFNFARVDLCLDWPRPNAAHPQGQPVAPGAVFPEVPTLVLSGDIDTVTSPVEGRRTAAQFPNATQVLVRNVTHITAIGDNGYFVAPKGADLTACTSRIIWRFIEQAAVGDTSCAARIRPIRTVPAFAARAAEVPPVTPLAGNRAGPAARRLAAATVETAGDVIARFFANYTGTGAGLRGGRFGFEQFADGYLFTLRRVRWVEDLAVSGTMRWNQTTGEVTARLVLAGAGSGTLKLTWNDRLTDARVTVTGSVNGRAVEAERLAP
jgi:pimeloyl-ACP methyl ester carboxylesterase